jgi:hypothetical protein
VEVAVIVLVAVAVDEAVEDAVADPVLEEDAVAEFVGQSVSQRHSGWSGGVIPARSLFSQKLSPHVGGQSVGHQYPWVLNTSLSGPSHSPFPHTGTQSSGHVL